MKTKDIASQYGLDKARFEAYLMASGHKSQIKENFWNDDLMIDDNVDIQIIVNDFNKNEAILAKKEAERIKTKEEKRAALANMLITSGFNFDGYTITKYSGYISGDDAISVPRGMTLFGTGTDVKDKLMQSLVIIRRRALAELKEAAYALGCNAVIGVDFDYLTLDPQNAGLGGHTVYQPYVFGVTANGNAVVIEKNK
jgi:uncharacterized protein YbjQ (UPF0145 family)